MSPASTTIGTTMNSSQGFATDGISIDANSNKINWIDVRNLLGNNSSIQPTSLENRFMILPTGFKSKNRAGACKTATTILSWRDSEHLRETEKNPYARMIVNMTDAPTRQP